MKSYKEFCEAISPTRLAQLKAKGKGEVARQIMRDNKLQPGRHQGEKEKAKRAQPPREKGGSIVKAPDNKMRVGGGALAKREKPKTSAMVRTSPVKDTSGDSTGFKRRHLDMVGQKNTKKEPGYLSKVASSAKSELKKKTVDKLSADKVGRGLANAPGKAFNFIKKNMRSKYGTPKAEKSAPIKSAQKNSSLADL